MSRFLSKFAPLVKTRAFSTSTQTKNAFLVIVHDYEDTECLQRRKNVRDEHLAVAKSLVSSEKLLLGGPVMDSHESGYMKGSMLLLNAESIEEIDKIITGDIYYKAKVWEKWEAYPYKGVIGTYLK